MKVLNIHAGISDSDIIDFVKEISIKAQKYEKKDRKEAEERKQIGQIYAKRKIWIFLDEINIVANL